MSGAGASPATPAGECICIMRLGEKKYVVKHKWTPHAFGLKITTCLMDRSRPTRVTSRNESYAVDNEDALCLKVRQKAGSNLKGARDKHLQAHNKYNGERP